MKKTGILLVNLGTPDSPSVADVRKYLREFLMDGRVIDYPILPRWLLVNLIIAPFRSPKSAKIYQKLWTERGSPLKYYGETTETQLQIALGDAYVVKLAMRYQQPSIEAALLAFSKLSLERIIILPLFPQYASATTGSIFDKAMGWLKTYQTIPAVAFINKFYDEPQFIQAFTKNAQALMQKHKYEHFVFSYHGVPERHIKKGDCVGDTCYLAECCHSVQANNQFCYRAQCLETTRLLVNALGLAKGSYTTCFQSRLGQEEWVKPYTETVVRDLASRGIKNVLAFSPAFVADCLETTIEVGEEYKELFIEHGGSQWDLVPSLNDSPDWIALLKTIVTKA